MAGDRAAGAAEGNRVIWPELGVTPRELLERAKEGAALAYVPYSRFHVGAAMLFEDGTVQRACNVENSSYGVTICAERGAVVMMVASGRHHPFAIAVVGSGEGRDDYFTVPCPPCGMCRQALMEFNPDLLVVLASPGGPRIFTLRELLPHSFTLDEEERARS